MRSSGRLGEGHGNHQSIARLLEVFLTFVAKCQLKLRVIVNVNDRTLFLASRDAGNFIGASQRAVRRSHAAGDLKPRTLGLRVDLDAP